MFWGMVISSRLIQPEKTPDKIVLSPLHFIPFDKVTFFNFSHSRKHILPTLSTVSGILNSVKAVHENASSPIDFISSSNVTDCNDVHSLNI